MCPEHVIARPKFVYARAGYEGAELPYEFTGLLFVHLNAMLKTQRSHVTLMCSHNDADSLSVVVPVGDKRPMYRPKGGNHFPAKTTDSLIGAHVRQYDFVILSVCVQVGIQVCTC